MQSGFTNIGDEEYTVFLGNLLQCLVSLVNESIIK